MNKRALIKKIIAQLTSGLEAYLRAAERGELRDRFKKALAAAGR